MKTNQADDERDLTVRLDSYRNPDYDPGSLIKRVIWLPVSRFFFLTGFPWPSSMKQSILRFFGAKIGRGVVIKPCVRIKYPWNLVVGDHCWIGENVWIDNLGKVSLGNHCCLSQSALILSGNHNFKKSSFDLMIGDITLEDGVWIGARASVGPGVTCGSHSVLTMGSTATSNLQPWMIYQGNPAKVKAQRKLDSGIDS